MYSVAKLQEIINAEIKVRSAVLNQRNPADLFLPVEYSLEMGGKRLRPVLLLLSYNMFESEIEKVVPAALAIEVFHNFTLLHDDIMDKADVRRNQPTVHKQFSENGAILSGDVMAFLSYQYLLECKTERLLDVINLFTKTAIEVCEGQQFDMDFENRNDVTEAEYLEMIRLKTAVLLACGLKAGALLANANNEMANKLYEFGINLGLAFQLQDDLLDSFGMQKTFGKRIGGDILANKKTYLLIKALENATPELKTELNAWINKNAFDPNEKINEVKRIFNDLGIKELIQKKINYYFQQSSKIVKELPLDDDRKKMLSELSKSMISRER